jgi:hypothetical protein
MNYERRSEMRTITFEDQGQDFLEWDINDKGKVVDCRPFQNSVWNGTQVLFHKVIKVGDRLYVNPPYGRPTAMMKYPVIAIKG